MLVPTVYALCYKLFANVLTETANKVKHALIAVRNGATRLFLEEITTPIEMTEKYQLK